MKPGFVSCLICVVILGLGETRTSSAQSLYDTNLIVNGGAECGPPNSNADLVVAVPGGTNITGNFTVCTHGAISVTGVVIPQNDPGPTNRGLSFFQWWIW
jgi:hypothetical protein